jgi:hypothetical protein
MSPIKRRYKRIEEFFAGIRPAAPEPPAQTAEPDSSFEPPAEGFADLFTGPGRGRPMGFAFDRGKVVSLAEASLPLPEDAWRVPLTASGKPVGSIQIAMKEPAWTAQEIEIVGAVAAQLGLHIGELRRGDRRE